LKGGKMKASILDIARVICSITPNCSGDIHQWDALEFYMKIRYICEAERFKKIANILLKKES
jgi:hypothetical protein